jgi:HEAT repeat protein
MFNYHTDLVWAIDYILSLALLGLAVIVIFTAPLRSYALSRRNYHLLNIKKKIHALISSGRKAAPDTWLQLSIKSMEQFLDIEANRGTVLFSGPERDFIKECFAASDKIARIYEIAQRSRYKWQRIEALLAIGFIGTPQALDILKKSICSKEGDVAYFSMLSLGRIKTAGSAKILMDAIRMHVSSGYEVASIVETFPATVADDLIDIAENGDPTVRFWAIRIIGRFKPKKYIKRICGLTHDDLPDIRAAACECLGELADVSTKDVIKQRLADTVWFVRMHAVRAIAEIAKEDCIPDVSSLLMRDTNWYVKRAVKEAMEKYVDKAIPYIRKAFASEDLDARKDCVEIIEVAGYLKKMFDDILSGEETGKEDPMALLKGMIEVGAHFGIESVLRGYPGPVRQKLLQAISSIDKEKAELIDKKIKGEIVSI